ncbi:MAG: helix-turn-helix domain-containing protein [Pseudomonadota bacterium]
MSDLAQNAMDAVAATMPSPARQYESVGRQLRVAREAAQLSLDEVANSLKFSPRQIEALEADNYDALPGATIVRGFVRSYARLLRLDADDLLRQLEPVIPSMPAEVRPPGNMGIASQPRGVRELSPLVTVALVLLLAAAMLVLWHFFGPAVPQTLPPAAVQEQPVAQTPPPAENPVVAPAAAPVLPPPVENVTAPQTAVPTVVDVPALQFSFTARSWVEVTDANKLLLHSGENPAGSQLMLTGKPPFDIVIGNASNVTLNYGGKTIDLAPHMRADVARLTLE